MMATDHGGPDATATGRPSSADYTLPIELQDNRRDMRSRRILFSGSLAVLLALVWAGVTPIREIAIAPGELVPAGHVRAIQHLEGGVVTDILVRDGATVAAGQPIVMLSASIAASDLGTLKVRRESLRQQYAQLESLLSGDQETDAEGQNRSVFEARTRARESERQSLAARADQRRAELRVLESETAHLEQLVSIQAEQLDMRRRLATTGYASRRQVLDSEAALVQARQNLANNLGRRAAARDALAEAEQQLATRDAEAQRLWSEEKAKVAADLAEVEESMDKHQDRFERLIVRAPIAGTVLQVIPRSAGEVVRAGDLVARFVPSSEPLMADIRIRTSDIAHVRAGDSVKLTISGTDPRVSGALTGKIVTTSPTSFTSETGEPFYRGQVALDPPAEGTKLPTLVPGMVVRAEVVTGAKTMLRYLLRPIFDTWEVAFRER